MTDLPIEQENPIAAAHSRVNRFARIIGFLESAPIDGDDDGHAVRQAWHHYARAARTLAALLARHPLCKQRQPN